MAPSGRAGVRRLWHGLRHEVIATIGIVRQTSATFWIWVLAMFAPLSLVGLLPLGRLSLVLQSVGLVLFGLTMLFPGILARGARGDDQLGLRDREGAALVTYLPALIELAALPFFVAGQTILFELVMEQVPGALPGAGWADAWTLSLNNLLFSEIFFDVIDVFRLGLAPDPDHRLGQVLIFLTRGILSVTFIRVVVQLFRAAYFRAHGLGRGVDLLAALRTAVDERDVAEVRHVADELATGLEGTIEVLVARARAAPDDSDAWRSLLGLREWAIPYLERQRARGPQDHASLDPLLDRLQRRLPAARPVRAELDPARAAGTMAALATGILTTILLPGWVGLLVGIAMLGWLGLWLAAPRRSLERCMDAGIVPACQPARLAGATVAWSTGLALILVVVALFTFDSAARAVSNVFVPVAGAADRGDIAGFVLANLLRLQLFLSAPDIFGIAVPTLEHQPLLGSALTLLFRSALNLGFVSVALTALGVSYTRTVTGTRLVANAELTMRIEALRGGRFGSELAQHHADLVQEELWSLLIEADDADTRRTLAATPLYEWRMVAPAPAVLGERLAMASVSLGLAERGWHAQALEILTAVDADGRLDHVFPAARVAVHIERGLAFRRLTRVDEAADAFRLAEEDLADGADAMAPTECEGLGTALAMAMNGDDRTAEPAAAGPGSGGADGLEQTLELETGLADGGSAGSTEPGPRDRRADQRAGQGGEG